MAKQLTDYDKKPINGVGTIIKNIENGWRGKVEAVEVNGEAVDEVPDDADSLSIMLRCKGINWWTGEVDEDDTQWHSPFDVRVQPTQAPQPGEAPSTTNFL